MRGVKSSDDQPTSFKVHYNKLQVYDHMTLPHPQGDEYVVYTTHQQRIQYIVEFTLPGESPLEGGKREDVGGVDLPGEEPVSEGEDA